MANVGLEFTMKDGSKEYYDPIDLNDLNENENSYQFTQGNGSKWTILKFAVESYRTYDLCHKCGYEIINEECSNYSCSQTS